VALSITSELIAAIQGNVIAEHSTESEGDQVLDGCVMGLERISWDDP
jgi:hypothetical protein